MTKRLPTGDRSRNDGGSVTPLVIGMMLCLLILGAGVTAAGSAFLAGQRLQHLCDGAAAAAAGAITETSGGDTVAESVEEYFAGRRVTVATAIALDGAVLTLRCDAEYPITFGALFATPTLHRTVTSHAQTNYLQQ